MEYLSRGKVQRAGAPPFAVGKVGSPRSSPAWNFSMPPEVALVPEGVPINVCSYSQWVAHWILSAVKIKQCSPVPHPRRHSRTAPG
jgi:hypothetical protein